MILERVQQAIDRALSETYGLSGIQIALTYPNSQFGDVATNVAFRIAKQVKKAPAQIAEELSGVLKDDVIAGALPANGFINIILTDSALWELSDEPHMQPYRDKVVVVEYSDPNPFKVLHAGHLYTTLVGDAVSNLLEVAGATVHRVNFGGDVGLHVGRTMWAVLEELGGEHPEKLEGIHEDERLDWLSAQYVKGTAAYDDNERAKADIISLNKRVYQLHSEDEHNTEFARIYWTCRQWSYDGFDLLYKKLGVVPFEKYYPESLTTPVGVKTVQDGLEKGVFEKSDGAVVYRGEADGLHTRVFLTSNGLPTYEAKDLGLAQQKWKDYHFDQSIIITGNDIIEYMKVVVAALAHFHPEVAERSTHLTHGMIKLAGGAKMSSRRGNILRATDVLEAASKANQKENGKAQPEVALAAIKYAFIKQRIGGDIVFDPQESVALQGNSGPYLQYAHARARSILAKAGSDVSKQSDSQLEPAEHQLLRHIAIYNAVLEQATSELLPSHIATYLYQLSQEFNRFYENNQVVGHNRSVVRLALIQKYADVLRDGLRILGIAAPDHI